jgi:hypothetical protein
MCAIATLCIVAIAACGNGGLQTPDSGSKQNVTTTRDSSIADESNGSRSDPASYEGVNSRGIPHYASEVILSKEDATVLRAAYGIEDPHRLYVSDSTDEGLLKYDTEVKRCLTCYVNSYRIGFVSVRRADESWDQAERRVRKGDKAFAAGARPSSSSLADLDPEVAPVARRMIEDARRKGFQLRVVATYRSPLREAYLMAKRDGRTHTMTSNHSYGRALDIVIDDGNIARPSTRRDWVAFRRWVTNYQSPNGFSFRILGRADLTWDWPHVEVPSPDIGFGTIGEAIARGRACLAPESRTPCNFQPHLPPRLKDSGVQ